MSKRAGVKIKSTVYQTFRGVDFTTDHSLVDKTRSPLATNMISDEGGNPEKRCGYERIANLPSGTVYGIYTYSFNANERLNLQFMRDGSSVSNDIHVDVKTFTDVAGTYGASSVSVEWVVGVGSAEYEVTVTRGSYTSTESFISESAVKEHLETFGITNIPSLGDSNTITFTTSKHLVSDKHMLVHIGNKIYLVYEDGTYESLFNIENYDAMKSSAVYLNGCIFIFTGNVLLYYNGISMARADAGAYVPLTVISCNAGATPGGVSYEGINYLSSKQRVGFKGNGTSADFHLPYTDVGSTVKVTVEGVVKTAGTHYNLNASTGVVTFTSGNIPSAPSAGAADNVEIEFTKVLSGYTDRINRCNVAVTWGVNGASDRIVCTGNQSYPNQDFISGYNNGLYFPDTDYQVVGSGATGIVGYRRIGDQLAIIKEDNGQDSTVFLRSGSLDTSGNAIWSTYPCLSGVGGVSQFGFGNIGDDQLVLTGNGIYAITSNYTTAEKIAEMRSKYLNPELVKEDLAYAHCVNFRNMMLTFFPNGHVYILDGRQAKAYSTRNETVFNYEGYYWENCPATYVFVDVENGIEQMYFGTSNGKLMKFMWDEDSLLKYSDGGYYNADTITEKFDGDGESDEFRLSNVNINSVTSVTVDNVLQTENTDYTVDLEDGIITFLTIPGEGTENIVVVYNATLWHNGSAITSLWATKADDDGDPMVLKTMLKKGNAVTMKPYHRSSAKVCLRTDRDASDWQVNYVDIFDWEYIDFSRFTFDSNDAPREVPFNRKVKNYKRLQIIIKNDAVNEGFGIFGIVKHYVVGNFAKR